MHLILKLNITSIFQFSNTIYPYIIIPRDLQIPNCQKLSFQREINKKSNVFDTETKYSLNNSHTKRILRPSIFQFSKKHHAYLQSFLAIYKSLIAKNYLSKEK